MCDRRLSDDDLGLLVWCAVSYDRRLPRLSGEPEVPDHLWDMLSPEWKDRFNDHANLDRYGAETKPVIDG